MNVAFILFISIISFVIFYPPIHLQFIKKSNSQMIKWLYIINIIASLGFILASTILATPLHMEQGIMLISLMVGLILLIIYSAMRLASIIGWKTNILLIFGLACEIIAAILIVKFTIFGEIYTTYIPNLEIIQIRFLFIIMLILGTILLVNFLKPFKYKQYLNRLVLFIVIFLILFGIVAFTNPLESGDIGQEITGTIFSTIMSDVMVQLTIGLMVFGGAMSIFETGGQFLVNAGKFVIVLAPLISWFLVFTGTYGVPDYVSNLFEGFAWFGRFMYLIFLVLVYAITEAILALFIRIPSQLGLG